MILNYKKKGNPYPSNGNILEYNEAEVRNRNTSVDVEVRKPAAFRRRDPNRLSQEFITVETSPTKSIKKMNTMLYASSDNPFTLY